MRKWFYPAQTVVNEYLRLNFEDAQCVRQTITDDVVYEHHLCRLSTGGEVMMLFSIHKSALPGQRGVITMFRNNGGEHLQYDALDPEPAQPVRERDTYNPEGI